MMIVVDEPSEAEETPGSGAGANRLPGYALAWRGAAEIAEAYRVRLRTVVLEEIDAGLSITDAAELTGRDSSLLNRRDLIDHKHRISGSTVSRTASGTGLRDPADSFVRWRG